MSEPEVHVAGKQVRVVHGGETLFTASLPEMLAALARAGDHTLACPLLPDGVRVWHERDDTVALALEVPPHARTVRWLEDDSKAPFGRGARYGSYFLAFPWVVLLLVFRRGSLTGQQQLYYRRAPLEADDELLLPNLYNVAQGYGQRAWVCLVNLGDVGRLAWPAKLRAVVDHVFSAGWNRSSEVHEGNSYFSAMRGLDPRIASPQAWEAATRANPRFALDVKWVPAKTTVGAELGGMLDRVVAPRPLATAAELAALLTGAALRRRS